MGMRVWLCTGGTLIHRRLTFLRHWYSLTYPGRRESWVCLGGKESCTIIQISVEANMQEIFGGRGVTTDESLNILWAALACFPYIPVNTKRNLCGDGGRVALGACVFTCSVTSKALVWFLALNYVKYRVLPAGRLPPPSNIIQLLINFISHAMHRGVWSLLQWNFHKYRWAQVICLAEFI